MKHLLTLFYITTLALTTNAQTKEDYILNYAFIAVSEMEQTKIPASITLAQGILESRYGTSQLTQQSNNHFGIKCHSNWAGGRVTYADDNPNDCFRKYTTAEESFKDHSAFLQRERYAKLFELDQHDYKGWAKGLRKAGYATDRKYADKLINIIEEYELYKFDTMPLQNVYAYVQEQRNGVPAVLTASVPTKQPTRTTPVKAPIQQPVQTVQHKSPTLGGPAGSPEIAQPRRTNNSEMVNRAIYTINDIKTVHSYRFDTPNAIAELYKIDVQRLKAYNEWDEHQKEFIGGMPIYLQPKRKKARNKQKKFHKVEYGQTMYQIAQQHGIKTASLYKLNAMSYTMNEQPQAGTMISLRKRLKQKPTLRNSEHIKQTEEQFGSYERNTAVSTQTVQQKTQPTVTKQPVKQSTAQPKPSSQPTYQVIKPAGQSIPNQLPREQKIATPKPVQAKKKPIILNPEALNKTATNEEEYEGRAIIYEPTPAINQQPVPIYQGSASTPVVQSTSPVEDITQPAPTNSTSYHKVQKGDTLYSISRKYGISVQQLKSWNKLSSNTIKIGQRLVVTK